MMECLGGKDVWISFSRSLLSWVVPLFPVLTATWAILASCAAKKRPVKLKGSLQPESVLPVPPSANSYKNIPPGLPNKATMVGKGNVEAEPANTAAEPELGKTAAEPELGKTAAEPEPGKTAAEPEPGKTATEPELGKTAAEPELGKTAAEPEPGKTAAEPEPGKTAAEPELDKTAAEPEKDGRKLTKKCELGPKVTGKIGGREIEEVTHTQTYTHSEVDLATPSKTAREIKGTRSAKVTGREVVKKNGESEVATPSKTAREVKTDKAKKEKVEKESHKVAREVGMTATSDGVKEEKVEKESRKPYQTAREVKMDKVKEGKVFEKSSGEQAKIDGSRSTSTSDEGGSGKPEEGGQMSVKEELDSTNPSATAREGKSATSQKNI